MATDAEKATNLRQFKEIYALVGGNQQTAFFERLGVVIAPQIRAQAFNKADGAYQNGLIGDLIKAVGRIEAAVGTKASAADITALSGKVDALGSLLQAQGGGANIDAAAVAAQILELLPDDLAEDVVAAMGRQLAPAPAPEAAEGGATE